jgi:hypothetical protein
VVYVQPNLNKDQVSKTKNIGKWWGAYIACQIIKN